MAVAMKGMEAIRGYFRETGANKSRGKDDESGEEEEVGRGREGAGEAEGSRVEEERKGEDDGRGLTFAEQVRGYMKGDDEKFDEACRRVYARFLDMGREVDVPDVIRKELDSIRTA